VLIDLADLGFTDPEGGTVAESGFIASFTLQAIGVGTGSITPAAPAGGVVFFDVNLSPAGTPSFSGTDMTVVPEPGVAFLGAAGALGFLARRRRRLAAVGPAPGVPAIEGGLNGKRRPGWLWSSRGIQAYPPAMAPTIMKGSEPLMTASGSGVSAGSSERSSLQTKNRRNGRRLSVPWSRMVPRRTG
jgi:MYXO-CTERM domain-containing protein